MFVHVLVLLTYCTSVLCSFTDGYHLKVGVPHAELVRKAESLRIVGGSQVNSESVIPHQAGILVTLTTGWTSICGGTLVANTRVITAAHCWYDGQSQAKEFTIVLGSLTIFTGGTRIVTKDVIVHTNWNPSTILYDIAMVVISRVEYNNNIQAITLPTVADVNEDLTGLTATASGYGKTTDAQNSFPTTTTLYHTSLKIISNTECQNSFDINIHASHLCTSGQGGVGTCDGDSGGPLTAILNNKRTLVGVVSFGLGNGCQFGLPSVCTRVTAFVGWIEANL